MSVELGYHVHRIAGSAGWRPPEWRTEPVEGGPQLELRLAEVERLGQAALGYADSVTLTMTGRGRMTAVLGGEEWMLLHEPATGTPLHSFGDPLREDRRVCWAGGYTELSARYFVPRTLAIRAVQRFVSSGTLDLRLAWTAVLPDVPGWEPARTLDDPAVALAVVEGGELGRLVLRGGPPGTTVTFEPAHRGNFLRAIRDGAGDPPDAGRYALGPSQVDRIGDAFHHGGLDLRTAWAAVLGLGRAT